MIHTGLKFCSVQNECKLRLLGDNIKLALRQSHASYNVVHTRRIWPMFHVVSREKKNMHGNLEKFSESSGIYFSVLIDKATF